MIDFARNLVPNQILPVYLVFQTRYHGVTKYQKKGDVEAYLLGTVIKPMLSNFHCLVSVINPGPWNYS